MNKLTSVYLKFRKYGRAFTRGQTMTEYALILAAMANVVLSPISPWAMTSDHS
jgi:hypothetical protein